MIAGSAGFTKAGNGLLVFNCANTYTGTTTLDAGTLAVRISGGLGSTASGTVVKSGASLAVGNSSSGGTELGEAITINGTGYDGAGALCTDIYSSYSYGGTVSGLVTLGSDAAIACNTDGTQGKKKKFGLNVSTVNLNGHKLMVYGGGSTTIGGLTGSGSVRKDETGTLIVNGESSFSGTFTVDGGTLQIGDGTNDLDLSQNVLVNSAGTLNFNVASEQTYCNSITGSGAMAKTGDGTLVFLGKNYSTGLTTISAGTLQLGQGTTNGLISNGDIAIAAGAALVVVNNPSESLSNNIYYTHAISGDGTLTKQGTATLRLAGTSDNTYTGLTTVSEGILQLEKATALGNTSGSTNVLNGASIYLSSLNGATINENLNLSGLGYQKKGALRNMSGTNTWAGDIYLTDGTNSTSIACAAGSLTVSGNITMDSVGYWSDQYGQLVFTDSSGSCNITVTGNITGGTTAWSVSKAAAGSTAGTLTLAGNNTYIGATEISFGTIRAVGGSAIPDTSMVALDRPYTNETYRAIFEVVDSEVVGSLVSGGLRTTSNGIVQIDGGAMLTIGGDNYTSYARNYVGLITGSGTLTKIGIGRQIFRGTNTYSGGTNVTSGTLAARNVSALGTGNVVVNGSEAVLDVGDSLNVGAVTLTNGTINGAYMGGAGSLTGTSYTVSNGLVGASLGGAGGLTKTTTGTVALTCSNTYTGKTAINGGKMVILQDSSLGAAPSTAVSDQLSINGGTLRFSTGIASINLTSTGGTYSSAPTVTIWGGGGVAATAVVSVGVSDTKFVKGREESTLDGWVTLPDVVFAAPDMPGGTTATGSVTYVTVGDTYTITGVTITNPGSGYSQTPLMWVVNGSNSTGGQIWAQVAAVTVNDVVLPNGSGYGYTSTPMVFFSSGNATATATRTASSTMLASTRGVTLEAGGGTIETDSGYRATIAGVISGSGSLTKTGAGTLTLTATNTYEGATTVSAGTLQIGSGGATGSIGSGNILNNGMLVFNRSNADTMDNVISGSGSLMKLGGGTLTLTGANAYSGTTTVSAGTLQIGNGGENGTLGSGRVVNNGTLKFDRSNAYGFSNIISGSGALIKTGAGKLTLTGANTYSGNTIVQDGTLQMNSSSYATVLSSLKSTGLDLQSGLVVFDYTGDTTLVNNVKSLLATGYAADWATGQIRNTTSSTTGLTLGYADDTANSTLTVMATYAGDFNLDGAVNTLDYDIWYANAGASTVSYELGDANYDGAVNSLDYDLWYANAGLSLPTSVSATPAPEPGTVALLLSLVASLGGYVVVRRRRNVL
ncbi:MAG: autotransporter-associated beta strand repeat-containing protein [Planctomycetaceae bacterium]|nr:autotransporter-associated beta strand repeat-containing protein [Planctomycetaceae bacterium]